jgi:hypothetical protein
MLYLVLGMNLDFRYTIVVITPVYTFAIASIKYYSDEYIKDNAIEY